MNDVKYWNGAVSPYSSPMNRSGTAGVTKSNAAASFTASNDTIVLSRSPSARLPTWSWFCTLMMKRSPGRSALGVPRARPKYTDSSPWKAKPCSMARAISAGAPKSE